MDWMKFKRLEHAQPDDLGSAGGGGGDGDDGAEKTLDIDSTMDSLAGDLGLKPGSATPSPEDGGAQLGTDPVKEAKDRAAAAAAAKPADKPADVPAARPAPGSWRKEMHDAWGKLDPAVQGYIESREKDFHEGIGQYREHADYAKGIRETFDRYGAVLQSQGITDHKAALGYLLNAHVMLSHSDPAVRAQNFAKLAQSYRIDLETAKQLASGEVQIDPAAKALTDRLDRLEGTLTQEQQRRLDEARKATAAQVDAFASDPAHAYFDEVAGDVATLLNDSSLSLEEAYERAVWANPVTRAKETARLQKESEESARKKAEEEAAAAEKARGTRVRGRDTSVSPQGPLGKMEDTMVDTLREIRQRNSG